jgi:flagellar biosynthesis protein FlhA
MTSAPHQQRTPWLGLVIPVSLIVALVVFIAPMPTVVLDLLLAVNITLSVIILLTALQIRHPLEFDAFPTILLGTTLFRLVLNVATTRLILSRAGQEGSTAAGGVVAAFSSFVTGGSILVGLILFLILVVVQFLVITQGATRVSEVSARFMLDSLPGRQSVIDSDLNNGRISAAEAESRRRRLAEEADFHGSMDGASKFVRGDAAAGLVITFVNLIGGLLIGVLQHGMTFQNAADVYSRLTIGDGLVTQLPALLIAIAAGLIVTRKSSDGDLPTEVVQQMTSHRVPLLLTGCLLILLSTTGLPVLPLLILGAGCLWLGWHTDAGVPQDVSAVQPRPAVTSVRDIRPQPVTAAHENQRPVTTTQYAVPDVELLTLELGVGLLRLVDSSRGGKLMDEISALRRMILEELGFVVPKILVRDAVELDPREYRIRLRDVPIAQGTAYHDALLTFDAGSAERTLEGIAARHPVTGADAHWIEQSRADEARSAGLKVLEPQQLISEHLHDVVLSHAAELLTRSQLHGLLNQCRELNGKLVDETVPAMISVPRLHQVLRALLAEQVPVRDLQAILEALSFTSPQSSLDGQVAACRSALSRSICRRFRNQRFEMRAWVLGEISEQFLLNRIDQDGDLRLKPADQARLQTELNRTFGNMSHGPHPAVLLTAAPLRAPLSRLAARGSLHLNVLSRDELTRDTQLVVMGSIEFHTTAVDAPYGPSHELTAEAIHE